MMYERDDSIDIDEWKERVSGNRASGRPKKTTADDLLALVPEPGKILKASLISKAQTSGIGANRARGFIAELVEEGKLFEHRDKRPRLRDQIYLAQHAPVPG